MDIRTWTLIIFYSLLLSTNSTAQIVAIDPPFFTIDSTITVTYDADKGNGGLRGVSQVYMHTGIITTQGGPGSWQNVQGNWGMDDPKVKMTNVGNNKHELTYNIRSFYNIIGNPNVTDLSFVFRNVDGTREGKTSTNGDIFIPLPEPDTYNAFFQSPNQQHLVLENDEALDIEVVSSRNAQINIYDNETLILEVTGMNAEINYAPSISGDHVIKFEATNGGQTITESFSFVYDPQIMVADPEEDYNLGLTRISENEVHIELYAPLKNHVFLISNLSEFNVMQDFAMNLTTGGDTWWIELSGLDPDDDYTYQFLIDGKLIVADPFSELVLDSDHDGSVRNFDDLPAFPKDLTSGRLTYFNTDMEEFDWDDEEFIRPKIEDLVIYEILMRDFLSSNAYDDLKDTLSYIKKLGINAIELMPVQEFEANDSWGYNPSFHMALDKYYGDPEDFKEFIDKAHENGIAVILDVVYNHAFGQSPLVQMYWDEVNNRPALESPYMNPIARHPFNVGYDFNHEKEATKQLVKQVLEYWIKEFHIDGFRFDLSKGFTQNFSANNEQMSAYDKGRISILKEYADFIWSIDPDNYVILEHFADNDEERELAEYGMMLWGNGNFNFNEATMGYHEDGKSDFTWQSYQERNWNVPHIIGYMESHDEERLMYKNLNFGNSRGSYNIKSLNTALDRNEMAAVFFFSIPGPKMIWQFGELGYDFSINRCTNGIVANCRLDRKPIRWDYVNQSNRKDLFDIYSQMIHLKKDDDIFETTNFVLDLRDEIKSIQLLSDNGNAVIVGNFDVTEQRVRPSFPHDGIWYDYFSDETILVSAGSYIDTYAPGEYHIYFDEDKDLISSIYGLEDLGAQIKIFPNPAQEYVQLKFDSDQLKEVGVRITDAAGKVIRNYGVLSITGNSIEKRLELSSVLSGTYYVELSSRGVSSLFPLIVVE